MSWWVLVHRTIIVAATVLPLAVTSWTGRSAIAPGSEAPAGRSGSTADRRTQERPAVDLWGGFGIAEGHEAGRYASLGAMVRWAPIVVAGTVDAVQGEAAYGEDDPGLENIRVMLRVTEVFKGDALEGQQIPVVVGLTEDGDVEQRFAGLVGDEGIFFIVQSGARLSSASPGFLRTNGRGTGSQSRVKGSL